METLKIPKEHQEKFEFYAGLPVELKSKLFAELKNLEVGLSPNALVDKLIDKLPLAKNRLHDIIMILNSLFSAKQHLEVDDKQFFDILKQSIEKMENLAFPVEKIATDLAELVAINGENLAKTSRIVDLLTDNQKIFLDANINNDIRPVFEDDTNDLTSAIVIHNLKIVYRERDINKEIFISLDSNDLVMLKEKIEIAERQLKKLKKKLNLNLIEVN
jgi:hypothetical protein